MGRFLWLFFDMAEYSRRRRAARAALQIPRLDYWPEPKMSCNRSAHRSERRYKYKTRLWSYDNPHSLHSQNHTAFLNEAGWYLAFPLWRVIGLPIFQIGSGNTLRRF